MKSDADSANVVVLLGIVAVWIPAMIAASYSWRHGGYYDYGWFVPPCALGLLIRRWMVLPAAIRLPSRRMVWLAVGLWVPWILVLRVLGHVDPGWRLPPGLLGLTAWVASLGLLVTAWGWRAAAGLAGGGGVWLDRPAGVVGIAVAERG